MKVSEWLREYQLTGQVPDDADDPMIPFWSGWLIGTTRRIEPRTFEDSLDMAIRAAEFIETHSK